MRERVLRQHETLVRLAKHPALLEGDVDRALRAVAEAVTSTLLVDRVGIWFFDETHRTLRCAESFHVSTGQHTSGESLGWSDHPRYFGALESDRVLAAHEAQTDPRTRSFADAYLTVHGITSMLDAPIRTGRGVEGVVCHEHVGEARHWELDEQNFAGSIADLVALVMERGDRARAQRALRTSQARLGSILENLPHVAFYETGEGHEWMSESVETLLGIPAYAMIDDRERFASMVHPEDLDRVRDSVRRWHATGRPGVLINVFRVIRPDGRTVWIEDHMVHRRELVPGGDPDRSRGYLSGVMFDVTDRREVEEERSALEDQLRQAQKMDAIGNLAGGVAHDFNNLLTGILGYADLLRAGDHAPEQVARAAEVIEGAARRASELTQKLLGFARRGKQLDVVVDMHEAVDEVIELLNRTLHKNIEIRRELHAETTTVRGDPAQMEHVLLNLAINARDAMPDGGVLTIESRVQSLGERDARFLGGVPVGDYLVLGVRDTGKGIADEDLTRVFEPFFTTKDPGKGTGMGLAMVYGIVRDHGGAVRVASERGQGTRFDVFLPIERSAHAMPDSSPEDAELRVTGRALVVDDEELVRTVAREMLERLGLEVDVVESGSEAVARYRRDPAAVDVVFLDMVMPGVDGRACLQQLREIDPETRVVLMTGYSGEGAQGVLDEGARAFVQKPFQLSDLARATREVLGERAKRD